jgi:CubicO group peptidase (beta-lactamase class C family)
MKAFAVTLAVLFAPAAQPIAAAPYSTNATIEEFVRPYVGTRNFSGVILVERNGHLLFERAYGHADLEHRLPNRLNTRFHVASMSMQFTAAAALRLINSGRLSLDTPVSDVVPGYPNGRNISVRNLLTQTSGIADINALDDYDQLLKVHQTPLSLVDKVKDLPPAREPGTYKGEEHSAYNLLALIVERKSGVPFAAAVKELVFKPLGMRDSGIDDDRLSRAANMGRGYQPKDVYEVEPADPIHWSGKTGNASAFTTAADELKFVHGIHDGDFVKPALRHLVFDPATQGAYGWFKSDSSRFGERVYSMNGRSPGFASALVFIPKERVTVVALSNIYASAPGEIAEEVAAIALGRQHEPLNLQTAVDAASLPGLPARFRFPADFYLRDAVVRIAAAEGRVRLEWPNGRVSALIPTSRDHYVDRSYWMPVEVVRDDSGHVSQLKYGHFVGQPVNGSTT